MHIILIIFIFNFLIFLSDILHYLYLMLKIYRMVCLTRIIFDQLPLFNPYKWPLSAVRLLTKPYFGLWSKRFPKIRMGLTNYEVSNLIALEAVSAIIGLTFMIRLSVLALAKKVGKLLLA